jgi:hypothetical protein
MAVIDLHFKVRVELREAEDPSKLAEEILRVVRKVYGVRRAELSSIISESDD